MNKLYQRLAILIMLVGGISCAVIYFTIDVNTLRHLTAFRPESLPLVLACMALGMYFDGTRLMRLVRIAGESISLLQAVQVIFGNYFLALLTPGAAGGALAQVVFLRRAGVPTGKATVLVLVRTLLSIFFLLICLPVIFYLDPGLLPWLSPQLLFSISVSIVVGVLACIWAMQSGALNRLAVITAKRLPIRYRRRIFSLYRDAYRAVAMLAQAPAGMLRVFVDSALSLIALYSVVPVLFMGIGASFHYFQVLGRMIFLNFFLYFAPTPGGSGIAEGGFVFLFGNLLPDGTVGVMAIAWRIATEYFPFVIGLYYTIKIFGHDFISNRL